jgi:flagellar basal body-associated protein FliL
MKVKESINTYLKIKIKMINNNTHYQQSAHQQNKKTRNKICMIFRSLDSVLFNRK